MKSRFRLDVLTPYGTVVTDEVDEVSACGSEGDFGVLVGHEPFITTLKIGMLMYRKGNEKNYMFINSGYADVSTRRVIILADSAEKADDIDIERARSAIERAEKRIKQAARDEAINLVRAEASLQRALTRIQLNERYSIK